MLDFSLCIQSEEWQEKPEFWQGATNNFQQID